MLRSLATTTRSQTSTMLKATVCIAPCRLRLMSTSMDTDPSPTDVKIVDIRMAIKQLKTTGGPEIKQAVGNSAAALLDKLKEQVPEANVNELAAARRVAVVATEINNAWTGESWSMEEFRVYISALPVPLDIKTRGRPKADICTDIRGWKSAAHAAVVAAEGVTPKLKIQHMRDLITEHRLGKEVKTGGKGRTKVAIMNDLHAFARKHHPTIMTETTEAQAEIASRQR